MRIFIIIYNKKLINIKNNILCIVGEDCSITFIKLLKIVIKQISRKLIELNQLNMEVNKTQNFKLSREKNKRVGG